MNKYVKWLLSYNGEVSSKRDVVDLVKNLMSDLNKQPNYMAGVPPELLFAKKRKSGPASGGQIAGRRQNVRSSAPGVLLPFVLSMPVLLENRNQSFTLSVHVFSAFMDILVNRSALPVHVMYL